MAARAKNSAPSSRWYPIELPLSFKAFSAEKLLRVGVGRTVEISSQSVWASIEIVHPAITSIELSIAWPALLNKVTPIRLVVRGKPRRSRRGMFLIEIVKYEFRLAGGRHVKPRGAPVRQA
jgi:hypothetical protein